MGFFSGSSTSTVLPIGKLFDSGVFSGAPQNEITKQLAEQFKGGLEQSPFLQDPAILTELVNKLASGGSFLGDPQRNFILDAAQSQFNKRGLNRITQNEALASLAPFEIEAKNQAVNTLQGLTQARGFDFTAFLDLIKESRPDLLVGSTTTGTSSPSGIAKLSALTEIPGQLNKGFTDLASLGSTLKGFLPS